ncbi:MAG TPA: HAD family hydrolase [Micromonosporaceae bacterium]|nr:HAD family hydrolase [Micromonosporaceae bacterium]
MRQRPSVLFIDFDGVLRRWDPQVPVVVEEKYGLKPGSLLDTAMHWSRLHPAITGRVSHAEWMAEVAAALAESTGGLEAARAAVAEWQSYRGEVDPDVLAFVREVRAARIPVLLTTNATDLLDADLAALGLVGEVDAVANSSVFGAHKPAKEYFQQACVAMDTAPPRVLFVDDEDRMVRGARVAGLSAYRWNGPADLPYLRAALALTG